MNSFKQPNYELCDIDHSNIPTQERDLGQNGFLLCKRGSVSVVMDERTYKLHAGDLCILPAFTFTQIQGCSTDMEGVTGMVDFDFALLSIGSISNTQSHIYLRFHPRVSLTSQQYSRIMSIIEYLRERKNTHTKLGTQVVAAFIQALCFEVIDAYVENTPAPGTEQQTRRDIIFQNFLIALYSHCRKHRDVRFYANLQNLTPRYFATLIREVSGKTPLQWIALFVIIEAKRLLSDPDISIKDAAYRLNFTDRSFFGHYFKQYAGCSPLEYKKALPVKQG